MILLASYILIVVFFFFKWSQISSYHPVFNLLIPDKITVVVAVKNESDSIINLLQSLENQTISKDFFEIIIVDDFSTDDTVEKIKHYASQSKNAIRLLPNNTPGKKNAISKAISKASHELIVATDADCIVPPTWLETIGVFFKEKKVKFAFGPVVIENIDQTLFQQMQQIEFASLVGSGAASWKASIPNMCNGANIAYTKTAFYEVNGFEGNEEINSGDDEFLMHKIFAKYPDEVFFIKSDKVLVETKGLSSFIQFYKQRTRWASKWEHYTDWKVKTVAFYVFAVNLAQIASFFWYTWPVALGFWTIRVAVEYLFLYAILRFMHKPLNLKPFLLLVMIYPIYVVFFALAGRFKSIAK